MVREREQVALDVVAPSWPRSARGAVPARPSPRPGRACRGARTSRASGRCRTSTYSPATGLSVARLQRSEDAAVGLLLASEKAGQPAEQSSSPSSPVASRRWTSAIATSALAPSRASWPGSANADQSSCRSTFACRNEQTVLGGRECLLVVGRSRREPVEPEHHAGVPRDVVVARDEVELPVVAVRVAPVGLDAPLEPAGRLGDRGPCGVGLSGGQTSGGTTATRSTSAPSSEDADVDEQASHGGRLRDYGRDVDSTPLVTFPARGGARWPDHGRPRGGSRRASGSRSGSSTSTRRRRPTRTGRFETAEEADMVMAAPPIPRRRTCARPGGRSPTRARPAPASAGRPPTRCCAGISSRPGASRRRDVLSPRFVWMASKETDPFIIAADDVHRDRGHEPQDRARHRAQVRRRPRLGAARSRSGKLYGGQANTFYAIAAQLKILAYFNLGDEPDELADLAGDEGPDPHAAERRRHVVRTRIGERRQPRRLQAGHGPRRPRGRARRLPAGPVHRAQQLGHELGRQSGFAYASLAYAQEAFTEAYGVEI